MFKRGNRSERAKSNQQNKTVNRAIRRTVAAEWEKLESRLLMSTDYLLNGNQETVITNGVSGTPTTVNTAAVTINATAPDNVTIESFSGSVTVNGGGGGDTITVYAGGGGTVTATDSSGTDQLVVRAPTTSADNFNVTASQITMTSGDTINYGTGGIGTVSMIGQLFSNGDSLAINGSGGHTIAVGASSVGLGTGPTLYYSNFNGLTVNGGASDNLSLTGDSLPTTLNAGTGNDTFNISTNSVALALNGGSTGNDTFTINSNSGLLTATGGGGNSSFTVYGSSSSMALTGGAGTNSYTVQSNSATLTINGGGTANTVTINGNSSTITARGGTGSTDSFTVNSTTGQVSLIGGTGNSTYLISAPTVAAVTVTGNSNGTGALTFDGTSLNNAFSVTANSVNAGSNATVGFTHMNTLTVNGIGGNDSFLLNGDTTTTIINGAAGNDTFNIQSTTAPLTINTGTGASTVNLGSNAPLTSGNTVAGLVGAVTVNGDGSDTLNFNDVADTTARTATLSPTTLVGLGTGGLTYSGLATLNLKLGSGGNTLAIVGTAANAITNFNTGSGANTVYLGSTNSTSLGGVLANFAGVLNLAGSTDALLLDDSGDSISKTVTLSPTAVTGLAPSAITYNGASSLTVDLGTAGNNFTITNTAAATTVNVNGNTGNDTLKVVTAASPVHLVTGGGADTVLVQAINAASSISSSGNSTIDIGSMAPATSGVLSGIAAGLTVTGAGTDTLTADDSGDLLASTGTLTGATLKGLGMATAGITYSGIAALNVNLGTSTNTFTAVNTSTGTATSIAGGAGADTITLDADASVTTITSGAGNDIINVQSTGFVTTINTGSGTDAINVGNNAPATPSTTTTVTATLTINGGGSTTLNLDDTGDNASTTTTVTPTTVTGISGGSGVNYSGLSALNVKLGSGGNTLNVNNTSSAAVTSINTGSGSDTVNVTATGGVTNINDGAGNNNVTVGFGVSSMSNPPSGLTNTIAGALNLTGNSTGTDTLTIKDGSDNLPRVATMTGTSLTGISPSAIGYGGFSQFNLWLGSANSSLTIADTITGSTEIQAGSGSNTITLQHDSGSTDIRATNSTIAIQTTAITAASTSVYSYGPDAITIGNPVMGGGRTLTGIAGPVQIWGNTASSLVVDDSADTVARTATLTGSALTGLSTAQIGYSNLTSLTVLTSAAATTMAVTSTSTSTTLTGGAGADTFNVQGNGAALTIAAGLGANVVNVGSNAPTTGGNQSGITNAITLTGTGTDTLNVDDTGDTTVRTATLTSTSIYGLGGSAITYTGQTAVNLSLGNAADTLNVTSTATGAATTVNTGNAGSTVNVHSTAGTLAVNSGAADTVNVGDTVNGLMSLIAANVTVTGQGSDVVNVNDLGDSTARTGAMTATTVTGLGATGTVTYTGASHLNVNLGTGSDFFTVNSTAVNTPTAINGSNAGNTVAVLNTSSATTITSPGTVLIGNIINSGGTVAGIASPVTVAGNGSDHLLVQDAADTTARTGTLSSTQLVLGAAVVNYSSIGTIVANLGSGGNGFTVNSTASTTPVTINAGTGADTLNIAADSSATTINASSGTSTINIGSTSDILDGLTAPVTVNGLGTNTLNVNDTGSTIAKTGTLTSTSITGFATDGITYAGIGQLNLLLGSGGNTVGITSTDAATTNVNTGLGSDTLNITSTSGTSNINTGAGNDTVNITSLGGTATVTAGNGTDTFNITNTGGTSNISSGSGADTYNISNTAGNTTISAGDGNDLINISNTGGTTTVNGNGGNDTFNVAGTSGTTTINDGTGTNTVNVGSSSIPANSVTSNIAGPLNLTGSSGAADTLNLLDAGDTGVRTAVLTATTVTGISPAVITYGGYANVNLSMGSGASSLTIADTITGNTLINTGTGHDAVTIQHDSGPTHLQSGNSTVAVQTIGAATEITATAANQITVGNPTANGRTLAGINAVLTLDGVAGSTALVDDSGDSVSQNATLTGTAITGLSTGAIDYSGLAALTIQLGSGGDSLAVDSTSAATSITGGTGSDTFNIQSDSSPLTLAPSGGQDTVNIGSNAPSTGGTLANITEPVTVTGAGVGTLNIDDSGDTTARTATLTSTAINGLGGAAITYTGQTAVNLSLGNAADTLNISSTAANAATAVRTGNVGTTVNVNSTTGTLAVTSGAADTVNIGDTGGSGLLNLIAANVTVTGQGSDVVNVNDTGDATSTTGAITSTTVTGLGAAGIINYTGLSQLNANLGSGNDTFTINSTATGTATVVNSNGGTNTVSVLNDSSTVAIHSAGTILIGSTTAGGGTVAGITSPVTVVGNGADQLLVEDLTDIAPRTGSLSSTQLTLGPSTVSYTGVASLGINLGSGGDQFTINSTPSTAPVTLNGGLGVDTLNLAADSSATTINAGSTGSTINIGSSTNIVDGLTAPVAVNGLGGNTLNVNDSGNATAKTGVLTANSITGLATAGIAYAGIGQLKLSLGAGGNTLNVSSDSTPTTINAGGGHDQLTITGSDNTLTAMTAPITVNGATNTALTVDDSGETAFKTAVITGSTVTGLNSAGINYNSLGTLQVNIGSGDDAVNVQGTASGTTTTITGNSAGQSFNVGNGGSLVTALSGPLTLTGAGSDPFVVDDSADIASEAVTLTVGQIIGLGQPISYTGMNTLAVKLGSGNDTLAMTGLDAAVPTSIDGGVGTNFAAISLPGDLAGRLTLTNFQTSTLDIAGSLTGTFTTTGSLTHANIGGDLSGTLSATGSIDALNVTGNLSGTLLTGGSISTMTVGGNLSGSLSAAGNITTANTGGDLSGSLTAPNLSTLHIDGSLTSTGVLNVPGVLTQLEIDGSSAGQTNVGSLEGVIEPSVTPAADGTIFSLTQAGVTRSIQVRAADLPSGLAGTTFAVVYDSSTGTPQAAVRVNGGVTTERFDLILNAPATSSFSLSRLDSTDNAATQVRNVAVDGSILASATPAETAYFGYASANSAAIQLPADNLAAVSARDTLAGGSILAASVQGLAFATLVSTNGSLHPGGGIPVADYKEKILLSAFAINAKTHRAYAAIDAPTETLLVPAGTTTNETGLFAGKAGPNQFDPNGIVFYDIDGNSSALANVTVSSKVVAGEATVSLLAWNGSGGSVKTKRIVDDITSDGPLGDVYIAAGPAEVLQGITAPSIEGTINLYAGKLAGTIQTTSGDLGQSNGSTTIALQMTSTGQIVSRGDLFSSVNIAGNFAGTIAAAGDIDGGIAVQGGGSSTGIVVAFGAINAPIAIAGSFNGQIASASSDGLAENIFLVKGMARHGTVVSGGGIGDADSNTALITQAVRGVVLADGDVRLRSTKPNSTTQVIQSVASSPGGGEDASGALANLWNQDGTPLSIDDSTGDLAGLAEVKSRLKALSFSPAGVITG